MMGGLFHNFTLILGNAKKKKKGKFKLNFKTSMQLIAWKLFNIIMIK